MFYISFDGKIMKKIVTKESIDTEVSSFKIIDYKCENGCTYFYVACPTCAKKLIDW